MSDDAPRPAAASGFSELLEKRFTQEQRRHLYQLRDSLGIANNDALWMVLVVLEEYDGLFKAYPDKLAAAASSVFSEQRKALAATVAAETSRVRRSLEQALVETVKETAGRQADAARWRAWAWVSAALVVFGGVCMAAGTTLAGGSVAGAGGGSGAGLNRILLGILRAPTGWTVFALLLPLALYYSSRGWTAVRDRSADRNERLTGAAVLSGAIAGAVACGAVLLRVLGVH